MRRADRLFRIVQHLRGRRLTTAAGPRGAEPPRLYAPAFHVDGASMARLESVRDAIGARRVLRLDYRDASGKASAREVWPFALYFWGGTWTLGAWCETREDWRNFRVDRIAALEALERRYPDQPGRRLADFLRAMQVP